MKSIKKIIYIILILTLLMKFLMPMIVYAKVTNYLATGDSIAYGYGLSDIATKSYPQIVRSKLGVNTSNFKNLAVSGMTCKEYYTAIQTNEYKNAIQNADLLTVSIGSNEMLGLITGALSDATGIPAKDPAFLEKVKKAFTDASLKKKYEMATAIYNFFTSQETKTKLNESLNTYTEYWDKSVKYIKSINNDIDIIATEFYNPYYEVQIATFDLSSYIDEWIVKMNNALNSRSNNETDYKIAKIYKAFNTTNPRLTNVDINLSLTETKVELDPHPNVAGHEMIAAKVMDAYSTIKEKKIDITGLKISDIKDQEYTGEEIKPSITIKDGTKTLVENKDFTLIYINNVEVGEAKINIVGIGEYTGIIIKTFNIKEKKIESKDISSLTFSNVENQIYSGIENKPNIQIKDGNYLLIKDRDYSLSYQKNINVGTANIIIKGIGNYTGSTTKTFIINPKNISETTVNNIEKQKYTGNEIRPSIVVYDGSIKLIENQDYKLNFENNVEVGTATVTITGINNYDKTIIKNFEIIQDNQQTKKKISDVQCSKIEDKIYTGKLITPEVILIDNEKTLIKNTDYFLTYENNLNIGVGKIIITGVGDYIDSVEKEFNIIKKDINYTFIEDISDQIYTGKEIKPIVSIENDKMKLVEGTDYVVEYKNNIDIGNAQIVITGINNFNGTMVKTFNIIDENKTNKESDKEINIQNLSAQKDKTVSNKELPFAGKTIFFTISIIIILGMTVAIRNWLKRNKDI